MVTNQTSKREVIKTAATTWGELQSAMQEKGMSADKNVNAIVRETKVTLQSPEAQLPPGDFTLFLVPKKVKSGARPQTEDVYKGKSEDQLRGYCRKKGISEDGNIYALRKRLRSYDKNNGIDSTEKGAEKKTKGTASTPAKKAAPKKKAAPAKEESAATSSPAPASEETPTASSPTSEESIEKSKAIETIKSIFVTAAKKVMSEGVVKALDDAQTSVITVIERLAVAETEQEVIDIFEGLQDEFNEVQSQLKAGGYC